MPYWHQPCACASASKTSVGVRLTTSNQLLLERSGIANAALVLDVVGGAPAASVDPIVALDEVREGVPRHALKPTDRVLNARHGLSLPRASAPLSTSPCREHRRSKSLFIR